MDIDNDETASSARAISVGGGLVIGVAMVIANAANYGFQIVAGRFLSVEEYGLLAGFMAVVTVVTVATSALQTTAARAIAADEYHRDGHFIDGLTKSSMLIGAVVALVTVPLSPIASRFFNIGWLPLILLGVYVVPSALDSIAAGRLQGLHRFTGMAVYSCSQAIAKLGTATIILAVGFRVTGLIAGLVLSSGVIAAGGVIASRRAGSIDVHAFDPDVRRAFAAFTIFWFMLGADVLFARAFFEENEAGLYAAASVLGKAVLWIPAVVAQFLFPRLAKQSKLGESVVAVAVRAATVVIAVVVVSVSGLYLAGEQVFRILYGERYVEAADIAWKVGLAVAPLALVNLLIQHFLARRQGTFLRIMVVVVIVEVLALYLGPKTYEFYALMLALAGSALLVGMIPLHVWSRHLPSYLCIQRRADSGERTPPDGLP
ncbi:MAG: oligosaccharide flippase family protein [Ilumatobacteraceae bacterium]